MVNKNYEFWKKQITTSELEHKAFISSWNEAHSKYFNKGSNENFLFEVVNTFNSNIFQKTPKPSITPSIKKLGKPQDVAVATSALLEPIIIDTWTKSDIDEKFQTILVDGFLAGRGVLWQKYECDEVFEEEKSQGLFAKIINSIKKPIQVSSEETTERPEENVFLIAVAPDDFLCSAAREEDLIWWKARRIRITQETVLKIFGKEAPERAFTNKQKDTSAKTADCWEIWDKEEKTRTYILTEADEFIKVDIDPYSLDGEFPCDVFTYNQPRDTVVPISFYSMIKTILGAIESRNEEISKLERIAKYKIVCNSDKQDDIQKIIDTPNGGIAGLNLPLEVDITKYLMVVPTDSILAMIEHKKSSIIFEKEKIYSELALSDLTRGMSDPDETAAAQGIKAQYGNIRFGHYQIKFEKFIESAMRRSSCIITKNFDFEVLQKIAGTKYPTSQEVSMQDVDPSQLITVEDLKAALDESEFNFNIDSSAFVNNPGIQNTIYKELMDFTNNLVIQGGAIIQQAPAMGDAMVAMARMAVSNSNIPKSMATVFIDSIEKAIKDVQEKMENPQPAPAPQPTPDAVVKANAEAQKTQATLALQKEKAMMDYKVSLGELEIKRQEVQRKQAELNAQIQFKTAELAMGQSINPNIAGDVGAL